MMEMEKAIRRKGASCADRSNGPIVIILFAGTLFVLSQVGIWGVNGYSLRKESGEIDALSVTGIVQACALAIAYFFFGLTHFVDPGAVELFNIPFAPDPELRNQGAGGKAKSRLADGSEVEFRWCWHCDLWRPPRAQHCTTCNRCFFKLDHHCPWTGTCIAAHNIRFFWSMLFWYATAALAIPVGVGIYVVEAFQQPSSETDMAFLIVLSLIALYFACTCGGMWIAALLWLTRVSDRLKDGSYEQVRQWSMADKYDTELYKANYGPGAWTWDYCLPVKCRRH